MKYEPRYPSDPGHPEYDQYMSLRGMVDRMHGEIDIHSGDISHRATAAVLRAYRGEAIRENASLDPDQRIDGIVLSRGNGHHPDVGGRYAILYQGDPDSPTVRTLAVPTDQLMIAAEKNFAELDRINQQREQQFAQVRDREQVQVASRTDDLEQMQRGSRTLI
jgi:hypothetical protein